MTYEKRGIPYLLTSRRSRSDKTRGGGVDGPFWKSVDQFYHFIVVVLYDACALWAHHLLSVVSALVHRSQNSILCRVRVASTTINENGFYELFHLLFQLFVGDWLVEKSSEFPICTLKAAQQLVPYEFRSDSVAGNFWGLVGLRHRARL
jgi:hypothetical protein